jgi:hypothetical protein
MPYIATEQTPPNYKSYFVQRDTLGSWVCPNIKKFVNRRRFSKKTVYFIMFIIILWYSTMVCGTNMYCKWDKPFIFISLFGISNIILPIKCEYNFSYL